MNVSWQGPVVKKGLVSRPRAERTGSLDSKTADAVFAVFEQLVAAGKTIFMATHDHELAARAQRIVRIEDGAIVEG